MPRRARIDIPQALHHVMGGGMGDCDIFGTQTDKKDFLGRLAAVLTESDTRCFAWSLTPNRFHLLIETSHAPLSMVMRKLMTGFAVGFNRRHQRKGHVFGDRYKSIVCDRQAYLLKLVRHIHLIPITTGHIPGLKSLDTYAYSGHSALIGNAVCPWQDCGTILGMFDGGKTFSRRQYRLYVKEGLVHDQDPDLAGGGLLRSSGGWDAVKSMRENKISYQGDERILGDSRFVARVLYQADETRFYRYPLAHRGITFDHALKAVATYTKLSPEEILKPGKKRVRVYARSMVCYLSARMLGHAMTDLAKKLDMSVANISISVARGETLVNENAIDIEALLKTGL